MGKAAKQVLIDLGIEPEDPIENWLKRTGTRSNDPGPEYGRSLWSIGIATRLTMLRGGLLGRVYQKTAR
jgi:hypothetical protein